MTAGVLDSRQKLVPEVFCRGIAGMTVPWIPAREMRGMTEVEAGVTKLLAFCGCANVSRRFGAKDIMAFLFFFGGGQVPLLFEKAGRI